MRLPVSPATPFSDASLPNHTKMFELVHMVTSMEDFGRHLHVRLAKLAKHLFKSSTCGDEGQCGGKNYSSTFVRLWLFNQWTAHPSCEIRTLISEQLNIIVRLALHVISGQLTILVRFSLNE
jgi:hypothetical protein